MTRGADDPEELNPPDESKPVTELIQEAAFDSDLIAHMVRCWDAERENASRLASKVTQIVSALALVFGLGLFKIEWTVSATNVATVKSTVAVWTIKVLLSLALILFGIGLFLGIKGLKRRGTRTFASAMLRIPKELLACPPPTDKESRASAYYRLSAATDVLEAQNREKQARVSLCETFFVAGLVLVLVATLTYILCSIPPITAQEVHDAPSRNDGQPAVTGGAGPNRETQGGGNQVAPGQPARKP